MMVMSFFPPKFFFSIIIIFSSFLALIPLTISELQLFNKEILHTYLLERGRRRRVKGLDYGALSHNFIPFSILWWGREARRATVLQHHHNILHCHNITARWKVGCMCVSRGHPQSPESERKDLKEERGCSVSGPAACWSSVEGDELCLCAARHSWRSSRLLLLLLLLLWATRRSHLLVHGLLAWHIGLLWGHIRVLSRQC